MVSSRYMQSNKTDTYIPLCGSNKSTSKIQHSVGARIEFTNPISSMFQVNRMQNIKDIRDTDFIDVANARIDCFVTLGKLGNVEKSIPRG